MNNLKVAPYEPWHLEKIECKEIFSGEVPNLVMTTAFTVLHEDAPIAILGCFMFVPGVMHVWSLTSEYIRKWPIEFHKIVLDMLKFFWDEYGLRRIQAEVKVTYEEGQRWLESLGFEREGLLKKFCPDNTDVYLYGRVS